MNQAHKSRSKLLLEAKKGIAEELRLKGYTQKQIAEEIKVRLGLKTCSVSCVCEYLKQSLAEWQKERVDNTDILVTEELERLNMVIREAWQMWEKSKIDYHKKGSTQIGLPSDDGTAIQTIKAIMNDDEERGKGDPRYLDIILKALDQRRKLLGLDKTTVDVNAGIQGSIEVRYVESSAPVAFSEDEVRKREGLSLD